MEGDPARWLCVVKSGRVKIVRHSRTGKDVVLELLGPGEIFGGVAVIEKRPYPAAAQATEPTVVLKIPADAMIAVAERHPAVIKEMALMIGRRLRDAHDSVKSLAVDPVEARLAAALLRLAERDGAHGQDGADPALPPHAPEPRRHDGHHGRDGHPHREPLAQGGAAGRRRRHGSALTDDEALRALAEGEARVAMPPLVRRYIKTSFVFLLAGLAAGRLDHRRRSSWWARYPPRLFITAHVHLLLVGFMLMMVMGVATWMFPRPAHDDTRYRPELAEAVYWLMTLSTALRAAAEICARRSRAPALRLAHRRRRSRPARRRAALRLNMWRRVRMPPAAAPPAR